MVANSNKKRFLNFSVALSIFNPCEHKCIALTKLYKKCIILAEKQWAIGPELSLFPIGWKLFLENISSSWRQ
jgi:hypothetical protein